MLYVCSQEKERAKHFIAGVIFLAQEETVPSKDWTEPNTREILVSTLLYVVGVFTVMTYEDKKNGVGD